MSTPTENNNKNKKRGAAEITTESRKACRRSRRHPKKRQFLTREVLGDDNVIEFITDDSHGMDQPGLLVLSKDEIKHNQLEKAGLALFKAHLKPLGWKWKRRNLEDTCVAPKTSRNQEVKNINMFASYRAIFEQYEEDGDTMKQILDRADLEEDIDDASTFRSSDGSLRAHPGTLQQVADLKDEADPHTLQQIADMEAETTGKENYNTNGASESESESVQREDNTARVSSAIQSEEDNCAERKPAATVARVPNCTPPIRYVPAAKVATPPRKKPPVAATKMPIARGPDSTTNRRRHTPAATVVTPPAMAATLTSLTEATASSPGVTSSPSSKKTPEAASRDPGGAARRRSKAVGIAIAEAAARVPTTPIKKKPTANAVTATRAVVTNTTVAAAKSFGGDDDGLTNDPMAAVKLEANARVPDVIDLSTNDSVDHVSAGLTLPHPRLGLRGRLDRVEEITETSFANEKLHRRIKLLEDDLGIADSAARTTLMMRVRALEKALG